MQIGKNLKYLNVKSWFTKLNFEKKGSVGDVIPTPIHIGDANVTPTHIVLGGSIVLETRGHTSFPQMLYHLNAMLINLSPCQLTNLCGILFLDQV